MQLDPAQTPPLASPVLRLAHPVVAARLALLALHLVAAQ
jgi:hypothetical protein